MSLETLFEPARLTASQREARVTTLVTDASRILDDAVAEHITSDGKTLAGICLLFSGGNDSTVLAHMFRHIATHAIHANTTIGIETTREFVRNTCEEWGLPLIERTPPRGVDHYRALVLDQGFPGPAHHYKMFQRLKERGLRAARGELVKNPRRERVVYLAGRRRDESQRRASVPEDSREGSIVWVSPLVDWTKADLTTYRLMRGDVPVNEVAQLIHMSGECLCGAFAAPGERAELDYWFHSHLDLIRWLETELHEPAYAHIPDYRKTWGWGAVPELRAQAPKSDLKPRAGGLCDSCPTLFDDLEATS